MVPRVRTERLGLPGLESPVVARLDQRGRAEAGKVDLRRIRVVVWFASVVGWREAQKSLGRLTPIEYEKIMTPQPAPAA